MVSIKISRKIRWTKSCGLFSIQIFGWNIRLIEKYTGIIDKFWVCKLTWIDIFNEPSVANLNTGGFYQR